MNLKEIFEIYGTGSEHKLPIWKLSLMLLTEPEKVIKQLRDLKADGLPLICFEGGWWVATSNDIEAINRYFLKRTGKNGKMTSECSVDLHRLGNMIMTNEIKKRVEV